MHLVTEEHLRQILYIPMPCKKLLHGVAEIPPFCESVAVLVLCGGWWTPQSTTSIKKTEHSWFAFLTFEDKERAKKQSRTWDTRIHRHRHTVFLSLHICFGWCYCLRTTILRASQLLFSLLLSTLFSHFQFCTFHSPYHLKKRRRSWFWLPLFFLQLVSRLFGPTLKRVCFLSQNYRRFLTKFLPLSCSVVLVQFCVFWSFTCFRVRCWGVGVGN